MDAPRLSRRQFVERLALAGAAAACPGRLIGEGPPAAATDRLFRPGLSSADFHTAVVARTAPARRRIARAAAFLDRAHPELCRRLSADAVDAMAGRLLLPGSRSLSAVGSPPDWLTPRYGDEEYLWSLNRMMHWKTLLRAHALTGEPRYAEKVVAELDDWIARARPPALRHADGTPNPAAVGNSGPPPWRSLEIGIRMYDTWPVVLEHLGGTPFLPPDRLMRMAASVAEQGEALSLLTPLLWPDADHNHYFMEMLGLLAIGVHFPELADASRWTDQSVHELQRCVRKQFTPDGSHIEAVPSYHNLCVVLLARFLDLARLAGRPLPTDFTRLLASSAAHSLHTTRPTGTVVPWGDATQRENHVEAALWAYRVTGDTTLCQHLAPLTGPAHFRELSAASIWELEDPAALFAQLDRPFSPLPRVRRDHANDQVMLRSTWHRDAASVFFSCHSPLLPGSGHQHIDLGGFDFTAFGRPLVVDPGVFTYRESAERRQFKSAAWHSVLTIDGRDMFEYLSRWRYGPQKEGRVTRVHEEPGRIRIDSFHRNYAPASCRRILESIEGKFLAVIDVVETLAPSSKVQIHFHLDSTRVTVAPNAPIVTTTDDNVRLAIAVSGGLRAELLPGRISDAFDTARPSTRVRFTDDSNATRRVYACVLAPFRATETAPAIGLPAISRDGTACVFACDDRSYRVPVDG